MSMSDRPELESDASELVPVASISVNFFMDANEDVQLNGLKKGSAYVESHVVISVQIEGQFASYHKMAHARGSSSS
jgi:hypothetical protein